MWHMPVRWPHVGLLGGCVLAGRWPCVDLLGGRVLAC